jgi:hypothetical protein
MVSHEIKSQLAKLLATEDLVVEHKKVETACFNVHTRVLTLPMWEKASEVVYDMLVGHEVGHALYTPDEDWTKKCKAPPQFVNVVEDVRIEKLMKRRYMGLSKSFYKGYKELSEKDFFCLEGEDLEKMNLADRINLHFKIGNFVDIKFTEFEEAIVRMVEGCEDFDDVLVAAEALYNYCKDQIPKTDQHQQQEIESDEAQSGENDQPDMTESDGPTEGGGNVEQKKEDTEKPEDVDPEVETMKSLEEGLKNLVDMFSRESNYVELPKLDLKKCVIPNSEIHDLINHHWETIDDNADKKDFLFGDVDSKYKEFKRSAQKEVNYLVKEFECRKSADSYARATTSRTGVLDCSNLHTYRYNEDLFKKVTTFADGKNHGLIFILDWSGSMQYVLEDTIKQLFNLIWFCRKVNIPFDVYAFTSEYPYVVHDENGVAVVRERAYEKKNGVVAVGEWFSLMNILTSNVNAKTLEESMLNIYRIVHSFAYYSNYSIPSGMNLSGTPLNESLIALHQIIPQFKKQHSLQKVQCVILTDGEANPLKFHKEVLRYEKPYMGCVYLGEDCFLRDRKLGTTYTLTNRYDEFTGVLLRNLRDNFKDTNFIGIRVLNNGSDAGTFIRRHCQTSPELLENTMKAWKKEKTFVIKNAGYHSYFALSSSVMSSSSEFDVEEDATKTQIKKAFVKSLKGKKMNKKILSEFINLVV